MKHILKDKYAEIFALIVSILHLENNPQKRKASFVGMPPMT